MYLYPAMRWIFRYAYLRCAWQCSYNTYGEQRIFVVEVFAPSAMCLSRFISGRYTNISPGVPVVRTHVTSRVFVHTLQLLRMDTPFPFAVSWPLLYATVLLML